MSVLLYAEAMQYSSLINVEKVNWKRREKSGFLGVSHHFVCFPTRLLWHVVNATIKLNNSITKQQKMYAYTTRSNKYTIHCFYEWFPQISKRLNRYPLSNSTLDPPFQNPDFPKVERKLFNVLKYGSYILFKKKKPFRGGIVKMYNNKITALYITLMKRVGIQKISLFLKDMEKIAARN